MGIACRNKVVVRDVWLLLPHVDKIKGNPINSGHNVSEYNDELSVEGSMTVGSSFPK